MDSIEEALSVDPPLAAGAVSCTDLRHYWIKNEHGRWQCVQCSSTLLV
jgi:hypothetical protein